MASSNKAFEAAARDASVFPRQVYNCSTAINLKTAFIPVTFIEIMADILLPCETRAPRLHRAIFFKDHSQQSEEFSSLLEDDFNKL